MIAALKKVLEGDDVSVLDPARETIDAKVTGLEQDARDLRASAAGYSELFANLRSKINDLRAERGRLLNHDLDRRAYAPDSPKVQKIDREIAATRAETDRIGSIVQAKSRERAALEKLVQSCKDGVRQIKGEIKLAPAITPTLRRGENGLEAVTRVQAEIERLKSSARAIETAPLPAAEAKQIARRQIEALAIQGKPGVSGLIARGGNIAWAKESATVHNFGAGHVGVETQDTLSLIAWLHRDALVAAVDRLIDAECSDKDAISSADRASKIANIEAEQLSLEYQEEALISMIEDQGIDVQRRADADFSCRPIARREHAGTTENTMTAVSTEFEQYLKTEQARTAAEDDVRARATAALRAFPEAPAGFEKLARAYAIAGLPAAAITAALRKQADINQRARSRGAGPAIAQTKPAALPWDEVYAAVNIEMGLRSRAGAN